MTVTHWDSEESIRAFAGKGLLIAKYYPEDRGFFLELEPQVQHFTVRRSRRRPTIHSSRIRFAGRLDPDVRPPAGGIHPMSVLLQQRECLEVALLQRDAHTGVHCGRVEYLCRLLGLLCDLNSHERNLLRVASKLHDVGKIGIADNVLLKPGRLDAAEWEVMKRHSELGQATCEAIPHASARQVGRIVRHHHEAFDGSGYPDGLAGTDIPICSRIISLADSYDAMTTTRPYHIARSHEEAMEIMGGERGKKSDPLLFGHFVKIMATIAGSPGWFDNPLKPDPLRGSA